MHPTRQDLRLLQIPLTQWVYSSSDVIEIGVLPFPAPFSKRRLITRVPHDPNCPCSASNLRSKSAFVAGKVAGLKSLFFFDDHSRFPAMLFLKVAIVRGWPDCCKV